jgi:2-octaprenyl-6-methoxyphenol hydroxylase
LAGQGFNMTIRDIKVLVELINSRIDLGIQLDSSICSNFEKRTKSSNYLFSKSIDFIYEFFNFENITKNNLLSKSVKFLGKNKMINQVFTKFADNGFVI